MRQRLGHGAREGAAVAGASMIRQDFRDLGLALNNIWFELRPVLTTRGRQERERERHDRQGFLRGRAFGENEREEQS